MVMEEPNTNQLKDMAVDEPTKGAMAAENETETNPLNYDDEFGSLEQDKALQTHKISDDDKRWVGLDPSGGLKKLILKEGDGDSPKEGEKISCHYSGFLRSNGDMFDSSRERGDLFKFEIGKGSVIKGWDQGIATMKMGERAILRCQSDFAYGEKGSEPKIPPNATLDFVVQLKDIVQYEPIWGTDDAKDSISKKTIKEVEGWDTAKKLWVVTVTYIGRENDEKGRVWCSGKDEEVKIPFDKEFESKGVIPEYEHPRGFYTCLQNTKEGEQNYFKLKSNDFYTFGSTGSETHQIAPNTDLFYDITITAMKKFNMSSWQLDEEEKIPKAIELKEIANDFFRRKKLAVAKEVYKDILDITTGIKDKEDEKANSISIACYSNTALVETHLHNLSEASEQIEKGLAIDPKHEKLRYRKALLHFKRGEFSLASSLLSELGKEFPNNKGVKSLAAKNARAEKASRMKAKKLAMKMFGPSAARKLKREEEERAAVAAAKAEKEKAEKEKCEAETKDDAGASMDTEQPATDAVAGSAGTKDEVETDPKNKEEAELKKSVGETAESGTKHGLVG